MSLTPCSSRDSFYSLPNEQRWILLSQHYRERELSFIRKQERTILKIARIQLSVFLAIGFIGVGHMAYGSFSGNSRDVNSGIAMIVFAIWKIHVTDLEYRREGSRIRQRESRIDLLTTIDGLRASREAILTTRPRPRYPMGLSNAGILLPHTLSECLALAREYRELNPQYENLEALTPSRQKKWRRF